MQQTRDSSLAVTTSSQVIIPANLKRSGFILTNLGAGIVSVRKGDTIAVANEGIVLQPNQAYGETDDAQFSCYKGAIQAIGSAAANLAISESMEV